MATPLILLVEDNPINALVISRMVSLLGEVIHVESEQEVFNRMKEHGFSMILMDINLGGDSRDGVAIMQELREKPAYADLPILAITSYAMPGDREKFIAAGFDEYVAKPVAKEDLLEKVRRFIA